MGKSALTANLDYWSQSRSTCRDDSRVRYVGDVAVACEDVDLRACDCCGGHGRDLRKLRRGLGSGDEQGGRGDAGEAVGLPVPALAFGRRLGVAMRLTC